jgi:hypothetical protein
MKPQLCYHKSTQGTDCMYDTKVVKAKKEAIISKAS